MTVWYSRRQHTHCDPTMYLDMSPLIPCRLNLCTAINFRLEKDSPHSEQKNKQAMSCWEADRTQEPDCWILSQPLEKLAQLAR